MAWVFRDRTSAAILTGAMLVLGIGHFLRFRNKSGVDAVHIGISHGSLAVGIILLIVNLRLGNWLALARSVRVAEMDARVPMWIIPLLTMAFVIWIGIVMVVTGHTSKVQTRNTSLDVKS